MKRSPPPVPTPSREPSPPGFLKRLVRGGLGVLHKAGLVKQNPDFLSRRLDQFSDVFLGDDAFLTGGVPLAPKQEDGAPPRQWQYPPGYNIAIQPRSTEALTFQQLRNLGDYTLIRLLIERIKETLKGHEWDIVPDDKAQGQDHTADVQAVKDFLESPDKRHDWDEWLGMILEDKLVIDAPAIYVHRTRGLDPRTGKGRVWALEPIDGATIKVLTDERGFEPVGPPGMEPPAYQQFLYGVPYVNLTRSDLIYRPSNRRANHFYGFSPVEQLALDINMGLRRELYNLAQFTDGNIPEAWASLPPDWKPQEIQQWQENWDAILSGDPQNRAKIRWMPGGQGVGITKMKDDEIFGLFNKFDEWLARKACFSFGLSPMSFIQLNNRAAAQEMGDQEAENGIASAKQYIERLVNHIIDDILMMPHLRFNWVTDRGALQKKRVDANVAYAQVGIKQIDEIRIEEGLDPLGLPPGMATASGYVPFPVGGFAPPPQEVPGVPPAMAGDHVAHEDHYPSSPGAPGERVGQRSTPTDEAARRQAAHAGVGARSPLTDHAAHLQSAQSKARLDELGKWERFTLNRMAKGAPIAEFRPVMLTKEEVGLIRAQLSKVKLPDEVRHIFATRRMAVQPQRLQPPRAGEAAHHQDQLRQALRNVLIARASSLASELPS